MLRGRLAEAFADDLPEGVHGVERFCGEPQFFPGATGLLRDATWATVREGSGSPAISDFPPATVRVMVVGNYHTSYASYQRILRGEIGGLRGTWGKLKKLLAAVPPSEVFLTNAFIGYPDLASDTARFPATPQYAQRCAEFLALQAEVMRPACIVCLGRHSAQLLARIATGLEAWLPWRSYAYLDQQRARLLPAGVGGVRVMALATRHPSSAVSNAYLSEEAAQIAQARDRVAHPET
jgi:uracil-DNA glycosylase family 4